MGKIDLINEFKVTLNVYEISQDAIDDDNKMLKALIQKCRKFLEGLDSNPDTE